MFGIFAALCIMVALLVLTSWVVDRLGLEARRPRGSRAPRSAPPPPDGGADR
ncbi:MAG: hypothetical protein H6712_00765 [Myxococcales bacterium]|nr:hypothetical protein [Myxococcales bacterium]MCB9712356.1 hypothetical protein [Myxococcales bacterium]